MYELCLHVTVFDHCIFHIRVYSSAHALPSSVIFWQTLIALSQRNFEYAPSFADTFCHCHSHPDMYTEGDIVFLENHIDKLMERNKQLNEVVQMLESEEVVTFKDGQYTDEIRETVMDLLSMNVTTSKVSKVIRVLKKLANKRVSKLPSIGTITEICVEARHLGRY